MVEQEEFILFEIPLDKKVRSLLRLERIFSDTHRHISIGTPSAHFYALKQIYILLEFFERGNFKAELIQSLDYEIKYFAKLKDNPAVDLSKLDVFIKQLDQLSRWARTQHGKIGQQLLNQDFLSISQKKIALPSACLSFDAPAVKMFLTLSMEQRKEKLNTWLKVFKGVQTSIEVILRLGRETGRYDIAFAEDGFYQEDMENGQYRFIGIKLPREINIFPEVSAGSNRFSIHFKQLDEELNSVAYDKWFDFQLAKYR